MLQNLYMQQPNDLLNNKGNIKNVPLKYKSKFVFFKLTLPSDQLIAQKELPIFKCFIFLPKNKIYWAKIK